MNTNLLATLAFAVGLALACNPDGGKARIVEQYESPIPDSAWNQFPTDDPKVPRVPGNGLRGMQLGGNRIPPLTDLEKGCPCQAYPDAYGNLIWEHTFLHFESSEQVCFQRFTTANPTTFLVEHANVTFLFRDEPTVTQTNGLWRVTFKP
jgi:hypothetical protein